MSNNKKTVKSSIFLGAGQSIEIVGSVILMPFLISQLGLRDYGLWVLINSIVGYFVILNMGLSTAIERKLCQIAEGMEEKQYMTIFSSGFCMLLALSGVALLMTLMGVVIVDFSVEDTELASTVIAILWIFGFKTILLLPTIAYQAVIQSQLRHDLFVVAEQVMVIVKIALILFVISRTQNIVHLALIIAVCESISRVLIVGFAVKLKGTSLLLPTTPSITVIKEFVGYTVPSIGIWFVERLRGSLPNFSISYFLGLEAIALYNIGFMIATYVGKLLIVTTSPLLPYFTRLLATSEQKIQNDGAVLKTLNYSYGIIIILISFYTIGFVFSGQSFISLFFDIQNIDVYYVGIIAAFYTLLFCSQHSFTRLFYSKGIHKRLFSLTVIETAIIFVLSMLLTPVFGIIGQAFAVLLPLLYTRHYLIYKQYQFDEHFTDSNLKSATRIWLPPVMTLSYIAYICSAKVDTGSWLMFVISNIVLVLIMVTSYLIYTKFIVIKSWNRNLEGLLQR